MQHQPRDAGHVTDAFALQRSEERFRLLVETVIDYAIYILGPTGIVESWNAGAQRLKGYLAEEIVGRHYSAFYPEDYRAQGLPETLLQTALTQGRVEHSGWRVRKDGTRFWADVVITALYDDSGLHTGFAKVTRDMTEAHLATEARERALAEHQRAIGRLEELDRWRREFIGAIIHDLQTPIIGISGFLELMTRGQIPDDMVDDVHDRLLSNARTLQELVSNLRSYTLLSDGRVVLRPERIPLRRFLDDLVADMRPVLSAHDTRCEVTDTTVLADRQGLERVLRNLLGNAARHTPEGTQVTISARPVEDAVELAVADDGPGIPAELLKRVFDRFQRGAGGGTGLGLSIASQLVALHDTTLEVDSSPHRGTTFRFSLPIAP
ncbi:MAG TPA: PAS domain-containing sensor histidine kinase [Egicoccus sp.]|nr:PAS domain-containing sensor histidine kinase [Egicoccus sp.]HSK22431.1 PAS domain-containing sensor histidine kinase [Egicoccus sp.]